MTGRGTMALALLLALGALAPALRAELSATVEPRIVDEFDTVRLIIRATGSNRAANLDPAPLQTDFEVLTTQSSSQYRSVNGRVESWVEYQIMLRPRRSGDLTIPPIQVGSETTEPLRVRVRGIDPALRETIDRMVFFETELTRNPVYVQAQTVLIRRLYYASGAQIYSDLPGMPELPDAIVMPLGETTSTATIRDGRRYGVIEQRFAILPERSGTLTVPAISITSSVRVQSGGRTQRSGVRVATEPVTLEVLPIPPEYPSADPWLPAADLQLGAAWAPDRRRLEVGDPVRLNLTASIRGNVSSAIPPLNPALPDDHFRRYPEPPTLEDDNSGSSVRGSRAQAYAIIPTAPGTVSIPPIEVVWWDVDERIVKAARVPGRTLTITGMAADLSDGAPDPAAVEPGPVQRPAAPAVGEATTPDDPRPRQAMWIGVLSLLLFGVLAVLLRGHLQPAATARATSEGDARRALRKACRGTASDAIQAALHDYLRVHYAAPLPEALRRFRAAGHGPLLERLNADRYQDNAGADRSLGAAVLGAVRALREPRRREAPPLPALYD